MTAGEVEANSLETTMVVVKTQESKGRAGPMVVFVSTESCDVTPVMGCLFGKGSWCDVALNNVIETKKEISDNIMDWYFLCLLALHLIRNGKMVKRA